VTKRKAPATPRVETPEAKATRLAKLSRRKGANWEREVTRALRAVLGAELAAKRQGGWQSGGAGAAEAADVKVAPRDRLPALWLECKAGMGFSPLAALQQARDAMAEHARMNGPPIDTMVAAVCKKDNIPPYVVMDMRDWLELVRRLAGASAAAPKEK